MKKLKIAFLVLLLAGLFNSCQNVENQEQEILKKEIFVIHDDVMPKTSDINRLQRKIRSASKSKTPLAPADQQKVNEVLAQLEKAHDGMMVWMNNFKSPAKLRSSRSHEEIMQYLQDEKTAIERVRDDMLNSIESGAALLSDLEKN